MNLQEILNLPASEKIDMVEEILKSLHSSDLDIPQSQQNEVDRRIALDKAGEVDWYTLKELKAKLKK